MFSEVKIRSHSQTSGSLVISSNRRSAVRLTALSNSPPLSPPSLSSEDTETPDGTGTGGRVNKDGNVWKDSKCHMMNGMCLFDGAP